MVLVYGNELNYQYFRATNHKIWNLLIVITQFNINANKTYETLSNNVRIVTKGMKATKKNDF